jgi:hypothetical protein
VILLGMGALAVGVVLLLFVISPRAEERSLIYTCERCGAAFGSPPVHPLPERYQEEDCCLCEGCASQLEEDVRETVRSIVKRYLADRVPSTASPKRGPELP